MHIAIYGRLLEQAHVPAVSRLISSLRSAGFHLSFYERYLPHVLNKIEFKSEPETFSTANDLAGKADFLMSIGGDGTLLDTVTLVGNSGIPVAGFNTGRLGFLAGIGQDDIDQAVEAFRTGEYDLDERSLLHLESNLPIFEDACYALNEFTLLKKDTSSMIIIHAYLNGDFLNTYFSDGLIVATPTGSTGYSLSCGGPVVDPSAGSFVVTPVAPHNLNIRPLVVPDSSVLSFEVEGRTDTFLCTLDSRTAAIDSSFQLAVRKEDFKVKLLRLDGSNFLNTLRSKLLWGHDKRERKHPSD